MYLKICRKIAIFRNSSLQSFGVNSERQVSRTQIIESISVPIEQIQLIFFLLSFTATLFVIESTWLKHFVDIKAGTQWIHWTVLFFYYCILLFSMVAERTEQQNADTNMRGRDTQWTVFLIVSFLNDAFKHHIM